jgi:hypothetical protein
MKEIEQITDYQTRALRKFLAQYKDSTNLHTIVDGKSEQLNDLEQALFEIRDLIYVDIATGAQLDILGRVWDVSRAGKNDTEYRDAIYIKISLRISGTLPEIIIILENFYGATYIEYYTKYPAKYFLLTDADISVIELERISPAGVGVIIKDKDDATTKVFGFHASGDDSRFAITHELSFLQPHS